MVRTQEDTMLEYLTLENNDQRTRWMDVEVVKKKIELSLGLET
jgi:hypothetical protein